MGKLFDRLNSDVRFVEGINGCINCGTCTAICPAAEVYDYEPRTIANLVQMRDDNVIEELLKSDTIWYCGECMSCKTRCPRNNAPGLLIQALRGLSIETGLFVESEKGRQQLSLKRMLGNSILETGYCVHFDHAELSMFPELGPVWQWVRDNREKVLAKVGANYNGSGPGAMRKISKENLDELEKIFEVTGGLDWFDKIEDVSTQKAKELGMEKGDATDKKSAYFTHVYRYNNAEKHRRK
ncbi:MAG: 4Fe-4S dicluster domain-containing protein [Tenuifilum sp.]|uniref:4Fe-4S dicluster domain-containing protein n=1 Tax=Tenuifilum sp. TaxID=2760880 RepID=UPI001B549690|nr:4Fe-4S dicluster domain-containing protein [Bacteroidales bacterium]HOK60137.1 4Fe-4S dicluster domain-containing protein [Tenuifilum sp.]MBP9029598.1 4Fe-4S dicluster domain-containing protein [Bacteroidales bacterium]HOK85608.1 4Fe-4S dicluster domain-containing protein [Tenuifilum sp.]HON69626.1 4Fe-4S dicluster domain-containing protein [Tenuifilum sp.]